MTKAISVQCSAISKQTKQQCKARAIPGGTVCRWHGGAASQVKVKAAVRAELIGWGLGDATVDPGEVLLRLVTQSAARAERYAILLEEAYEAAERLKQTHDAGELKIEDSEMAETARRDLDRIFNTGGVAALVGNTYGAAKDVGVYVTGEAIRGLADLEAKERGEMRQLRIQSSSRRSCRTNGTNSRTPRPADGGDGSTPPIWSVGARSTG